MSLTGCEDFSKAPTKIQTEVQGLEPSAIIELFQLELTQAINGVDQTYYYHAGTNDVSGDIVFDGITYAATPIEFEGFEVSARGTLPRPVMRVGNAGGGISSLLLAYNPLKAKVTRIRTCKKFLDGESGADSTARFPLDIFFIDRVSKENLQQVEFELVSKLDLTNLQLPCRQVTEYCPWVYRGTECGYAGTKYFDANDNLLTGENATIDNDVCGKRFSSCKKRFDQKGDNIPHGGFPGSRIQI